MPQLMPIGVLMYEAIIGDFPLCYSNYVNQLCFEFTIDAPKIHSWHRPIARRCSLSEERSRPRLS